MSENNICGRCGKIYRIVNEKGWRSKFMCHKCAVEHLEIYGGIPQ